MILVHLINLCRRDLGRRMRRSIPDWVVQQMIQLRPTMSIKETVPMASLKRCLQIEETSKSLIRSTLQTLKVTFLIISIALILRSILFRVVRPLHFWTSIAARAPTTEWVLLENVPSSKTGISWHWYQHAFMLFGKHYWCGVLLIPYSLMFTCLATSLESWWSQFWFAWESQCTSSRSLPF